MSFYTKFQDVETLITSSSSGSLGSTDVLLAYSNTLKGPVQVTLATVGLGGTYGGLGAASPGAASVATSATTATNIGPTGLTLLKSTGGSSTQWLLTDPTAVGQVKELIFLSSTTSTLYAVQTVAASIQCTGGSSANLVNFASTATGAYVNWGQGITMVSQSTTSWIVINVQRNMTAVTSGIIFAVGTGPIFQNV